MGRWQARGKYRNKENGNDDNGIFENVPVFNFFLIWLVFSLADRGNMNLIEDKLGIVERKKTEQKTMKLNHSLLLLLLLE